MKGRDDRKLFCKAKPASWCWSLIARKLLLIIGFAALQAVLPNKALASAATGLYSFCAAANCRDGEFPYSTLLRDKQGNLYGTTEAGGITTQDCAGTCGTVFKLNPPSAGSTKWTLDIIHLFKGPDGDSGYSTLQPTAALIMDAKGNLYGTAPGGGYFLPTPNRLFLNAGTAFELTPPAPGSRDWGMKVLYKFCSTQECTDGGSPLAGLVMGSDGNLYGTTEMGGGTPTVGGAGTVFKLSPPAPGSTRWTETVLHSFSDGDLGGGGPEAGLIMDKQGRLYGTTTYGGARPGGVGGGTVFMLSPPGAGSTAWTATVLHSFSGAGDGAKPTAAPLVMDPAGNLYGTTSAGGVSSCAGAPGPGCGVVYELSPPGPGSTAWTETILHRFRGGADGVAPYAGLLIDNGGNLYGTTYLGGRGGNGTAYKLSPLVPGGKPLKKSTLYQFGSFDSPVGNLPVGGLIEDAEGNFYGAASSGSMHSAGTIYRITP